MSRTQANAMNGKRQFAAGTLLAILTFGASALIGGCSSSEGYGNLLAGQACDAFTMPSDPRCVCCSAQPGACVSGESPCAPEGSSPTCGARCPEGLECVAGKGGSVCGKKTSCQGPERQACGNCGTQSRTCEDGNWSAWSECTGEGECTAGTTERCENGSRTCSGSCSWGVCETCACQGRATQACAGGEQVCDGCQWGACVQYACQAGDTQQQDCGNCGKQTLTCSASHTWETSECQNQGECSPGDFQACGGGNYRTCSAQCGWGACETVECTPGTSDSEACGNCGTRTRDCVAGKWTAFGACKNAGNCKPTTTQACGNGGMQTCSAACQWEACTGQKCDGSPVELCGNCGFHSRTCNNGAWSAFGACTGERDCLPGDSQACGANTSQTCGLDCYWGACQ